MAPHGPNAIVAYWLLPAEPMRGFFASTIAELATRFAAPLFEPHVTIYATRMRDTVPAEILRRALGDCTSFRLAVRNVQYSDEFTKTVFVQFEPSLALSKLSRALQQASTLHDEHELNPHLSLLYKGMTRAAKMEVAASVSLPFTEVIFDFASAIISPAQVRSRQDVEAWKIAAMQRLAG